MLLRVSLKENCSIHDKELNLKKHKIKSKTEKSQKKHNKFYPENSENI